MIRVGVLVTLVLSVAAGDVRGFELLRVDNNSCGSSQHLFWTTRAATVNAGGLPVSFQQLGNEARLRWNASLTGFDFRSGAGQPCDAADGTTTMAFSTTYCDGESLDGVLAVTRSRWNVSTGALLDADVTFNAEAAILQRDDDVFLEVAMHELGHVLGLDHSDTCGASGNGTLMKSVLIRSAPRILWPTGDDLAGANFIYPPEGAGGEVPEGANSCAIVPPARANRGGALLLSVSSLLLVGVRMLTCGWSRSRGSVTNFGLRASTGRSG